MAVFDLTLPGNAAVASEDPDLSVERAGTYGEFNGGPDVFTLVHFPFTIPLFFGVGPPGTAARMRLSRVFVTFYVVRTVPVDVQVRRIRAYDGYDRLFVSPLVAIPEYDSDAAFTRYDSLVDGKNSFDITPPPWINKSISVSVAVNFGAGGGVIRFTRAGAKLVIL